MRGRGKVIREVTQASRRKWAYLREAYGRGGARNTVRNTADPVTKSRKNLEQIERSFFEIF